jgi:hypothetical protein
MTITSRSMTAAEIHEKSVRDGHAEIIRKFGSAVALKTFGIASTKHVDSPEEKLDRIATAAADRALKKFMAPAKASTPKPTKPTTSTTKAFTARGPNWSVKRFSVPFSR